MRQTIQRTIVRIGKERIIMRIRTAISILLLIILTCLPAQAATLTDAAGREIEFEETPTRVVSLLGSYGEVWLAAGGVLVGTTEDSVDTPAAQAQGDIANLGSHSEPNMELLFSLEPDFVILSLDTAAHPAIAETLESAGIPYGYFSMIDYEGYMDMLKSFTDLTGREDLYEEQVETVLEPIEELIAQAQQQDTYGERTVLLLRAYSSSVKAKDSEDTVAGPILKDMGLVNVADGGAFENLTMEAIIAEDPDYIMVVMMGSDQEAAEQALEDTLLSNPAWSTLTAVQEGRYVVLDRDLFHYRPNSRWAESYEFIWELLYAEE